MQTPDGRSLLRAKGIPVDDRVLRDAEAALLGLLPDGHRLGGPVGSGASGPTVTLPAGLVDLDVVDTEAGVALLDPENTPVAVVHPVRAGELGPVGPLHPGRARESGEHAQLALTAADLRAATRLVVLARPPVDADGTRLQELLAAGDLLVVVPDSPTSGRDHLPTSVLLAVARALVAASPGARLRTAPLARRDAVSDARLLRRLVDATPSTDALVLDGQGPGGQAWARALDVLDVGDTDGIPGVGSEVAQVLLRWRPPVAERGLLLMFTGFSGSGKSTVARDLAQWVAAHTTRRTTLLDGDLVRQMLSSGLGFDRAGRVANVRRIGYVGSEVARHGGLAICSPIAPYAETRAEVRAMVEPVGDFVLVHVNTPLEECEKRDLKGLYAKARAGIVPEFTGISDPYDVPEDADLRVDTSVLTREQSLAAVLDLLQTRGWLPPAQFQTAEPQTTEPQTTDEDGGR